MEHAVQLFATKGIESTSIQEITEHCGISKGAFYLSFKSKDELISYIIDYFMQQITIEIDQVVNGESNPQTKLYQYFLRSLTILYENLSFTKTFLKEQRQTVNEDFIKKISYYDQLINQSILQLLDELYGENINDIKYDLLITIKGFVSTYSQLLIFEQASFDFPLLAKSLVEKTNILATYTKTVVLTENTIQMIERAQLNIITFEQVMKELEELLAQVTEPLELETLTILKDQLNSPAPSQAIVTGMLNNLKPIPNYQWLIYIVKSYTQPNK